MTQAPAVTRDQVLAFRLAGQHLAEPLAPDRLPDAAGACGLQDTPPGSAPLGLLARVDGLTPDAVDAARAEGGTLLEAWSIRASPHLVPSGDLAVFTLGLLPTSEAGWAAAIAGFAGHLPEVGLTATEAVEATRAAIDQALDGRVLTKRELGAACQPHLPPALRPWFEPSRFSEFTAVLARAAALTGLFCMVPRSGGQASFARTDQWLGHQPPPTDPDQARAELLRRYLRCYGPSTAGDYAAWAGIAGPEAERTWALLEGELSAVSFEGADRRLLAADLPALLDPQAPSGIRLLPPYDPWLQQRERALLVADAGRRRLLWRASGNPGVVLADGEIVATWRPARQGRRLTLAVTPLAPLDGGVRAAVEELAAAVAGFRGAASADVQVIRSFS